MGRVNELVRKGQFVPLIDQTYPLGKVAGRLCLCIRW